MPIPRFVDPETGEKYDISLVCPKCHWAVVKDTVTEKWDTCRSCEEKGLETRKYNYGHISETKPQNLIGGRR